MGIALYLVLQSDKEEKGNALQLFGIQLALNAGWPVLFFYKINVTAARLLYPYLAWVTFAGYLNLAYLL